MSRVRAKKSLGQHFLNDEEIAENIVDALKAEGIANVLEVGPGMGVLTKYLLKKKEYTTSVVEIDTESIEYLQEHYPEIEDRIINDDFLKMNLQSEFDSKFGLIGNFPYNISSQIFFKVLENKNLIPEIVGMLQKEVAERLASPPGSKAYGILSVLLQAYYNIEYLFTVDETVFTPPPKVKSAVIRVTRNNVESLDCDEKLFKRVIKTGFNQRRKTISNSLKPILLDKKIDDPIMGQRPEQLSVQEFVYLTNLVERCIASE